MEQVALFLFGQLQSAERGEMLHFGGFDHGGKYSGGARPAGSGSVGGEGGGVGRG
ncbi:hypothetical protein GCM10008939_35410 [Deinococcus aquiradiocola]|uniref:Uncharacterized protein n=1 Tax=Deinococcus aquiradiocola TaxID=393059 RepID=A0A917UVH6_9DEIO|nr:hypothetical protein GCM10008939_35410 [Deinococcus aquiradiocola]